jgi:hypothetical protein
MVEETWTVILDGFRRFNPVGFVKAIRFSGAGRVVVEVKKFNVWIYKS